MESKKEAPKAYAGAPDGKRAKVETDWREKSVNEFGLVEIPEAWTTPKLEELSRGDNKIWKKYYDFRVKQKISDADYEDGDDDDDDDDDHMEKELANDIRRDLRVTVEEITKAHPKSEFLASAWLKHTKQSIQHLVAEDYDTLRTADYAAVIFSPYAIPHAVAMSHGWHNRARYYSCEFYATWGFNLVRFDGKGPGDNVQKELAARFPKGYIFGNGTPCDYNADAEEEYLCSTSYIDPPSDAAPWMPIRDIQESNFSPITVRRIRSWPTL